MYNFEKRLNKLLKFDNIRILKFLEIFEYSLIFSILIIFTSYILNKTYYKIEVHYKEEIQNKSDFLHSCILMYIDIILIVLLFFYIRKVSLLFPSISSLINKKFKAHTTLDYTIHIALVVLFIEFLPKFKKRVEHINKFLLN